jgi:hypothetical protein
VFKNDITFVTLATRDRIHGLPSIMRSWSGIVHVAYYIDTVGDVEYLDSFLKKEGLDSDPKHLDRRRLTVHVVWKEVGRVNKCCVVSSFGK